MKNLKNSATFFANAFVGLAFSISDFDGSVDAGATKGLVQALGQENVFRWSMVFFWFYFVILAFWNYRGVFDRTPRPLTLLAASIGCFYIASASRLFLATGSNTSFVVYEYRNLSLFAILGFAVLNRNARLPLRAFCIGWIITTGSRAWSNVALLFLGRKQFHENLGVQFSTFDGTQLSQEVACSLLSIGLARALINQNALIRAWVVRALLVGCVLDSLGSFRRTVYLRFLTIIMIALSAIPGGLQLRKLIVAFGLLGLMGMAVLGIFGAENVAERASSYRIKDFSKTMDASNEFYLESWAIQLDLAKNMPLLGYGLRNSALNLVVDGSDIQLHTGFHAMWLKEGVFGLLLQVVAFVVIPVLYLRASRKSRARAGSLVIGGLVGFCIYEGLFPYRDQVIGNMKSCVAIGLAIGLAVKRIEESRLRLAWIRSGRSDELEIF
jgi:hypothetical protein